MRGSHGKLLEGSFAALLKSPWLLEFDNKKAYFRSKIRQRGAEQPHYGTLRVTVRRPYIIEDSFNQVGGWVGGHKLKCQLGHGVAAVPRCYHNSSRHLSWWVGKLAAVSPLKSSKGAGCSLLYIASLCSLFC